MVRVFPCSSAIFPHVRPASLPFKGRGGDGVRQNGEETHPHPVLPPEGEGKNRGKSWHSCALTPPQGAGIEAHFAVQNRTTGRRAPTNAGQHAGKHPSQHPSLTRPAPRTYNSPPSRPYPARSAPLP